MLQFTIHFRFFCSTILASVGNWSLWPPITRILVTCRETFIPLMFFSGGLEWRMDWDKGSDRFQPIIYLRVAKDCSAKWIILQAVIGNEGMYHCRVFVLDLSFPLATDFRCSAPAKPFDMILFNNIRTHWYDTDDAENKKIKGHTQTAKWSHKPPNEY